MIDDRDPGADLLLDEKAPTAARTSSRIGRLVAEAGADQPGATREVAIARTQAQQALAARRSIRRDATIVFLVGCSSWTGYII